MSIKYLVYLISTLLLVHIIIKHIIDPYKENKIYKLKRGLNERYKLYDQIMLINNELNIAYNINNFERVSAMSEDIYFEILFKGSNIEKKYFSIFQDTLESKNIDMIKMSFREFILCYKKIYRQAMLIKE